MRRMSRRWLAPLAWMGVIFYFSHQSGVDSADLSGWFVTQLTNLVPLDPEALSFLVRKGAHVSEYALLGALLAWAWPAHSVRRAYGPTLIGILFAVSDEVHQRFVPGRSGQVSDVLIDSVGVLIGVLLIVFLASRRYIGAHVRHDGTDHERAGAVRQEQ